VLSIGLEKHGSPANDERGRARPKRPDAGQTPKLELGGKQPGPRWGRAAGPLGSGALHANNFGRGGSIDYNRPARTSALRVRYARTKHRSKGGRARRTGRLARTRTRRRTDPGRALHDDSGNASQLGAAGDSERLRPTKAGAGCAGPPNPTTRPSAGTGRPVMVTTNTEPTTETRLQARILKHVKTTAPARLWLNHMDYSLEGTMGCP
jgi:hypothetical protein